MEKFGAKAYKTELSDKTYTPDLIANLPETDGLLDGVYGKIKHILLTAKPQDSKEFFESVIKAFDEDVTITILDSDRGMKDVDNDLIKKGICFLRNGLHTG